MQNCARNAHVVFVSGRRTNGICLGVLYLKPFGIIAFHEYIVERRVFSFLLSSLCSFHMILPFILEYGTILRDSAQIVVRPRN